MKLRLLSLGCALVLSGAAVTQAQFRSLPRFGFPTNAANTSSLAVGDYNLDGAPDIFLVDFTTSQQFQLLKNDGRGNFEDVTSKALPAFTGTERGWKVKFFRADPDPFLDIIIGMAGQNRLYMNQRNGTFKDMTANLPSGTLSSYGLDVGDVDGDGDQDILIGNTTGKNELWLNDGLGKFSDATASNLPAGSNGSWDAVLADADGDRDLDAFFANSTTKTQQVYINDGKGMFKDESTTRIGSATTSSRQVVIGDVDGDGDNDLFYANYNLQNWLYINDGKGNFKDETSARLPTLIDGTYGAHMFDVDEDGDLDIATANFNGNIGLFLNDGKGKFTDASARFTGTLNNFLNMRSADVDRDGDLDLVCANYGAANAVFMNHEGQLYAEKAPAIGNTYNLDFWAQPGYITTPQAGVLLLGIGELAPRATTPWGPLGIAPPWFVLGGFVATPQSQAKATVMMPIPNDANFKSFQLWFQALHIHTPIDTRLTNVWMDTVQ